MKTYPISCFKAYDIRGKIPSELNEELAYNIGLAYTTFLAPHQVVVGRDIRLSSLQLTQALISGLNNGGADVLDIGICGTEEVYFATFYKKTDGGIMVTASHNPVDYNGMKLIREEARPISSDTGLKEIETIIINKSFKTNRNKGSAQPCNIKDAYLNHISSYVNTSGLNDLKVVVNPGNGCAGQIVNSLEKRLPFQFIKINDDPDGNFPNGVPNPLLPENRKVTVEAVKAHNANAGIAWDGDFDRCFLFDENGGFIEAYYIVGILATNALERFPGAKIIHDPRLTWNTIELVKTKGGIPIQCKSGHAFIKERMRLEEAIYGGEMSGHHYFREFSYCDSGMIPWLIVLEAMCRTGKRLSEMVAERMTLFPASGEINRRLSDPDGVLKEIEDLYKKQSLSIDYTDGISIEFPEWRFNIRKSNTEPVVRLNVEARKDLNLMKKKTEELLKIIDAFS